MKHYYIVYLVEYNEDGDFGIGTTDAYCDKMTLAESEHISDSIRQREDAIDVKILFWKELEE